MSSQPQHKAFVFEATKKKVKAKDGSMGTSAKNRWTRL